MYYSICIYTNISVGSGLAGHGAGAPSGLRPWPRTTRIDHLPHCACKTLTFRSLQL